MLPNEYTFHGKRDINYLFYEGAQSSEFLLVAFQAIPAIRDGKPRKLYNYTKFLSNINVNRLFIEDTCGESGCYYLCENMNFEVEETVIELIESIIKKYNIKRENVITLGSSKGGSVALYYGLKYGFGHIISAAPQTRIAYYLNKRRPSMLQYMVGEDLAKENLEVMDSIILEQVKPECKSEITLLTSKNEPQYKPHIIPLLEAFEKANVNADVYYDPRIVKHRDIATYFPNFLVRHILRIINETVGITPPSFDHNSNSFTLIEADNSDRICAEIKIVSNNRTIEKAELKSNDRFEFKTDELLSYSAVYTVYSDGIMLYTTTLCDSIFDQGYFDYKGYSMRFDSEAKEIEFTLDIEPHHPVSFSFSLNMRKFNVVPPLNSDNPSVKFSISESGTYVIDFDIKVMDKGVLKKSSERFPIAVD